MRSRPSEATRSLTTRSSKNPRNASSHEATPARSSQYPAERVSSRSVSSNPTKTTTRSRKKRALVRRSRTRTTTIVIFEIENL